MATVITVLILVGLAATGSPAEAQIYSWRDANGNLVLSDRPLDPGARSFHVTSTPSPVRTTRPRVPSGRTRRYEQLIERHAAVHRVRPELVRAVIQVESAYNPHARSPKGAMGLMQLMPATAAEMGVDDPYDPADNIRGGVMYLRRLLDRYGNNEELALAAYNAGPTAVEQYGNAVPPYRETRRYVSRVKDLTAADTTPARRTVYKTIEIIDGRPVPRYSDTKPPSTGFDVVTPLNGPE